MQLSYILNAFQGLPLAYFATWQWPPEVVLHIQGQPYYDDEYYEQELSGFGYSTKMLL